ncbi:hypothetical protein KFL_000320290 [Klebsormidium nitens]|uniref:Uncharacterized protein n=1 Tax=Klebsormidium nitens TaxID=105231 RepID=A0A1Y1HLN5_KLENI|nr:hypothetical protein KFL_000320290 [Klebsormidium nitens]|eukprot:GAQ79530.1 hypothetical protein KFL_000320290 [Klebsormidium nitens]
MPGVRQRAPAALPPYAQWFQLVDPGLLTNKTIRQYLLAYNAEQWPEVVKLTLLYGILSLQKQYGSQALAVQDLRDIIGQNKVAAAVEQSIPGIEKQLADLRAEVLSFQQDLGPNGNQGNQPPIRQPISNPPSHQPSILEAENAAPAPARQQRVSFAEGVSSRPEVQTSSRPLAAADPSRAVRKVVRRAPVEHGQPGVHFQRIDRTPTSGRTGGEGNPQVHFTKVVRQPVVRGRAYIPSGDEALAMALKQAAIAAAKMNGEAYEPGEGEEDESAVNYPDWYTQHPSEPNTGPPSGPAYPDWWGHEVFVPPPRKAKKAPRAPPRLAYSVPREDPRERQLYEDDLVTAEYLGVPGSGYGQRAAAPRQYVTSAGDIIGGVETGRGFAEVGAEGERRQAEVQTVPVTATEVRGAAVPAVSGVNTPARRSEAGDQGSARRQSSGWVATIPVSEIGKRPKRRSSGATAGESVATAGRAARSEAGSERSRRGTLAEGVERRVTGGQGGGGESGGEAAAKKKAPVKSRVRAEIEAQRRYEEQKAAARLKAAQELLYRPRRGTSEEPSPEQSAATSPQSAVGRIADQFLEDPWMAHFQDPVGSTMPAFERFGLAERSPGPSIVPSGTLLAAAAAASVLLGRRSPETERSARSSPGDSRSSPNLRYEEPQEAAEVPQNAEAASLEVPEVQREVSERERSAAPDERDVESSAGDRQAVGREASADRELGNRGVQEGEDLPGDNPRAGAAVGTGASPRSEAPGGSGKTSDTSQPEELRGLPGGGDSEASQSPSLSSFTSFTTTGSLESNFQSTAESGQVA